MIRRILLLALSLTTLLFGGDFVVFQENNVYAHAPKHPLTKKSLQVTASKAFTDHSTEDYRASFHIQQKIATALETDQFLVYGKQDNTTFHWEVVPYPQASGRVSRTCRQMRVLWRTVIGGTTLSPAERQSLADSYAHATPQPLAISPLQDDAFCDPKVIDKQLVLEGEHVNVLYNYAPLKKLHFLITPKAHRTTFRELTEEEYVEAMELAQKLIDHFQGEEVHMLHKSGIDAGQTVPHWHLHLIITEGKADSRFGKLKMLKGMVMGTSPLKDDVLKERVTSFRQELAT